MLPLTVYRYTMSCVPCYKGVWAVVQSASSGPAFQMAISFGMACARIMHGGQGRSRVPPYTRGSVSLSLTGGKAKAWCLPLNAEASLSWPRINPHVSNGLPLELLDLENARLRDPTV